MKVYYTPEFSQKAERQESQCKKTIKQTVDFLKAHELHDLAKNPDIAILSTPQKDLYILMVNEVRIFASFRSGAKGDYVILVDIESRHGGDRYGNIAR